jgi:hypothetical protein
MPMLLSSPTCFDQRLLELGVLGPERRHLFLQLVALRLGVERGGEPPGDVAHRLQRLAGPFLDRREDLHDSALDAVQRTARRLTEVCG